ncbi:MAG: hypothetical protein ABH878_06325 [bacterium]
MRPLMSEIRSRQVPKWLPVFMLVFAFLMGCEETPTELEFGQEWAHITGTVKYAEDLTPAPFAFVRTQTHLETTLTDSIGVFDLAIALPDSAQESVTLEVFKEGFVTATIEALIEAGKTTPLPVITLERFLDSTVTDTSEGVSGPAVTVVLISLEPDTLSVTGAGGQSASQIICEARDASGNPVDSLHAAQIEFEFISNPGGGAHIYPESAVTDDSGRVSTNFYAGTDAGFAIVKAQLATSSAYIVLPQIIVYETGAPASIRLIALEYDSIAVKGVGANETSTATFVVKDAGGSPLSAQQPTTVYFSILGAQEATSISFPNPTSQMHRDW